MREKFKRNNSFYSKSGLRRKGGIVDPSVSLDDKKENPAYEDQQNRNNVLKIIVTNMKNGGDLDQILDKLCSDEEINKQFKYLKDNGIDLRNTFEAWYKGYLRRLNQKPNMFNMSQINDFNENGDKNDCR